VDQLEYLTYLAKSIPSGTLARAAARRLAQRAAGVLRRNQPPTACEVFDSFCASDAPDLALKLAAPRASACWADSSRREEVLAGIHAVPGALGRVLARADAVWKRDFRVFGRSVSFGRSASIDWQLDPLSGERFDPTLACDAPELWREGLDPKGAWMLGRFEQAIALGQGVWLSPTEEDQARFAQEFAVQVRSFARENPPGVGIQWSSPMEIALRATNVTLAFLMMRHRPELQDPDFALSLASLAWSHGDAVEAHLEHTGAVPNNHYVANLVGLLHLGVVFPELPRARAWRERALAALPREMERQVLDDGFSFEGSTSYHRLALELFLLAFLAARAGRLDLGEPYRERLHGMFRAVRAYLTPAGRAPQIGDNDSGRALALCERETLDHRYLLSLGAALFGDPELKVEQAPADEVLFLLGSEGVRRLAALPESAVARSGSLRRAGLFFLRSGSAYCAVSCGPNGQAGVGGHSHNDKLAVEIHQGERPVVVDCGTGSYTGDPEARNAFRSTRAHSTVEVDGAEQNRLPRVRLFALPDDARARSLAFESSPMRERFVGEHRGYERLAHPVRHVREVVYHRGGRAFVIGDALLGTGVHEAVIRFQLPDEQARMRPALEDELARLARCAPGMGRCDAVVELGPEENPTGLLAFPAPTRVSLRPSRYSPSYGESRPSLSVELEVTGELPLQSTVIILLL